MVKLETTQLAPGFQKSLLVQNLVILLKKIKDKLLYRVGAVLN